MFLLLFINLNIIISQNPVLQKPRIIVSTDIGGTDCDDYQSVMHLLMYTDLFDIEGIISNPSSGKEAKDEILHMINYYKEDYPYLKKHYPDISIPKDLMKISKEGRVGLAPYKGYGEPTEGSRWIVRKAREKKMIDLYGF
jgi:hypothetical protein